MSRGLRLSGEAAPTRIEKFGQGCWGEPRKPGKEQLGQGICKNIETEEVDYRPWLSVAARSPPVEDLTRMSHDNDK